MSKYEYLYHFLDYFFLIFHTLLVLINVLGWVFKKTIKIQRIALLLTLFSWLVLGFTYGWGYCILTDWHWDVLRELGQTPSESAYIQYLFKRLLNITISRSFSDTITILGLIFGAAGAVFRYIQNYKKLKQ